MLIIDHATWLILLTLAAVLLYVELNSQIRLRFRLRPDLSSEIRPDPAPAGFGKVKSGTSLNLQYKNKYDVNKKCKNQGRSDGGYIGIYTPQITVP